MIESSSPLLEELNPTVLDTQDELEEMPSPEILPTDGEIYNDDEPVEEYPAAEIPVPLRKGFDPKSLSVPLLNNYVPRGTNLPEVTDDDSVLMASFRRENSIGSFLNRGSSRDAAKVDIDKFNFMEHLKPEQLPDLEYYALDMSQADIDDTADQLAKERKNEAILQEHPVQSFGAAFITSGLLDPINYLPYGAIYKQAKKTSSIAKVFATGAMDVVASTTAQEALFHNTQLTRTLDESIWNVTVSGLLGGALGSATSKLGKQYKIEPHKETKAYNAIMDIMIEPEKPFGGAAGAAQAHTVSDALADIPDIVKKSMFLSPGVRLASSDFKTANQFNSLFVENTLYTEANAAGLTYGPALETYIKQRKAMVLPHVVEYNNAYYAMLGIEQGPALIKKGRAAITTNPEMSSAEFAKRVSQSLFTDIKDYNPFVQRATEALRKGFEESRVPLVELGYLPDIKGTKTSEGYLTIVPNKQLIIEQGGRNAWGPGTYPQAVFDGFKRTNESIKQYKESFFYKDKLKEIETVSKELKNDKVKLEERISEIKKEIADRAPKYTVDENGELYKIIDDDEVLRSLAQQHVDKILSQEGDSLFNPVLVNLRNKTNSLKSRTLMVDQEALSQWHIQDPVKLLMMHSKALAPFIEKQQFARKQGFKDFEELTKDFGNRLTSEYDALSMGKTGKEAAKLEKKFREVEKDIQAIMDLLDGVYGAGENTVTSTGFQKFLQGFRDYNYLTLMGNITVQSFNDIGSVMIRNGVFNTLYHGMLPMLTDMRKLSKRDLKALNFGLESDLGMSVHRYLDNESLSTNPGILQKSADALQSVYGDLTLFNQWTARVQRLSMVTSINHTLDSIHRIVEGKKVAKKDRTRLASLGIKEEYFKYIYDQTNKPENISSNGTRVSDWTTWVPTNKHEVQALRDFQAATVKDVDQTIIQPGVGDRPLFSNSAVGRTLFQFKSFAFASTNKILYSAIQRRRDLEVYTGITAMLSMGAMSYVTTKYLRGEEPELDLKTLSLEAVDRSGVMGILMEVFDISQSLGIIPGEGATRYQSRGITGAITGPTIGTINDIAQVIYKISTSARGAHDITTTDIKKLLRLFPLQNIGYIMSLNEELVTAIRDEFNLIEDRKGY